MGNNPERVIQAFQSFVAGSSAIDQIHLMHVFVTVGEESGFASASRKLDVSPAAVTRAIVALEGQLGVRLLLRTTRNVRMTDAGRQYFDSARAILASIAEANEAVSGANSQPQGTLSITAPILFGRLMVLPCIVDYMRRHPLVEVSAVFLDRVVNVVEEGIDVAIRIGHLPDSALRATRVGQVRRILCAAPGYLEAAGLPVHPSDLLEHTVVSSSAVSPRVEWRFGSDAEPFTVRMKPRLTVTSNDAALSAAIAGVGITRLFSYQVAQAVQAGQLRLLMEEFEEPPWPVHVVHREGKYGSLKIRRFIDSIVAHLRQHPDLQA